MIPVGSNHRLASRGGPGLVCDEDGLALGPAILAEWECGTDGARRLRVRLGDFAKVLRLAYGGQLELPIENYCRSLNLIAALVAEGNQAAAMLRAVLMGLPEISADRMAKLGEAEDLCKRGDSWQNQPRVPAGQTGGGEWTTGVGGADDAQREVNPASLEEIANRDYHDEVVAKVARIVKALGCTVATEIPLVAVDGLSTRADILMMTPDGIFFIIEVKTGVGPKYEDSQRIIYPMAMLGGHVFSPDPRITEFGFEPGELLPPMGFDVAYKRDRKSRLQIISPGGSVISESE